jgi:predicted GH43/DUF377 family glycosyl hydrolase
MNSLFDNYINTKFIKNCNDNLNIYGITPYPYKSIFFQDITEYSCQRLIINGRNGLLFKNSLTGDMRLRGFDIESEDPRLVCINGVLYTVFIAISPYGQNRCIGITKFNEWNPIFLRLRNIRANSVEKNWAPFEKNNKLYFVYTYDPLVIIHYDFNNEGYCDVIFTQNNIQLPIENRNNLRGSSNLVHLKDDIYIGCCHSGVEHDGVLYYLSFIVLLDTNDWNIKYLSKPVSYKYYNNDFFTIDDILIQKETMLFGPPKIIGQHNPSIQLIKNKLIITVFINEKNILLYELEIDINNIKYSLIPNDIGYYNSFVSICTKNIHNFLD